MGGKPKKRFVPPTPKDVEEYCQSKGLSIDGEDFCDFYGSKDWMVGKNKMKDWQLAANRWARKNRGKGNDSNRFH